MSIEGSCHCGAVRFVYPRTPDAVTRCNCSYCRRSRGRWAYAPADEIELSYEPGEVVRYIWGDRMIAIISCKTCGCTTHWESIDPEDRSRMGVNFAMVDPQILAAIPVRDHDGASA
jgi:hypothetical protein